MDERVSRVLREVWGSTEGYVFLPQKLNGRWSEQEHATWPNDLWLNSVEPMVELDHYFCPLVFGEPARRKEHALPTHVLWADLDEADPRTCALIPSIAWITTQGGIHDNFPHERFDYPQCPGCTHKPHWQALWLLGSSIDLIMDYGAPVRVNEPVKIPAAEAAELSKRIAYAEPGADRSGWDVTQVLRLPGTYNHKHDPPQRIELLWAKRLYYTVEQIRAAYPPVPRPEGKSNGGSGWHEFTLAEIAAALANLPVGVQMALERDNAGADRSLELLRLARELLRFGVAPAMVPHLLMASPLNKFAGRADEHERLLTAVADALQSATQ